MPEPITWDDVLRRIGHSTPNARGDGEPVQDVLDEKSVADRERFRSFLADLGPRGADALRGYDAAMRDHDSGVSGARMCWHSISPAQRRALLFLAPGRALVRCGWTPHFYDAVCATGAWPGLSTIAKAARLDTVRNLAARGLVRWDGGAFDPEARAVVTERAVFVLEHGRTGTAP